LEPVPATKLDRSKDFIPFPVVFHKPDRRGKLQYHDHSSDDVERGEYLVPVAGIGLPFGAEETSENVKTQGFWYHIPRGRAKPKGLGGDYNLDFVNSVYDPVRSAGGGGASDKVFVSPDHIRQDFESTEWIIPDTR
jgi:hypothetical protein